MSGGEWKQGLCNCCGDCSICCCSTFCTPCLVYRNGEGLGKSGFLCCLLGCIMPCIPTLLLRTEAREKYNLDGSVAGDVGAAFCCTPCVNCQTAVEIQERTDKTEA